MWFLVLVIFFNALADHDLVLRYRLSLGGFPVNAFDVLLLILGPVAVLISRRSAFPTERVHPALPWIFVLFVAAMGGGLIGSVMSGISLRSTVTTLRNLFTIPLCVWLGYCMLLQPRSAERVSYAHVYAGIVTAFFVLLYFGQKATTLAPGGNIDVLRAMKYIAGYAGIAAVLLLYSMVSGVRMFRPWLAIPLCGFCFLGQFATLSRSDWLAVSAAVAVVYFLLPAASRGGKIAAVLIGPPLAMIFLWLGLFAASALTGQDFNKKMADRLYSMLPGDTPGVKQRKAWDTRLKSTLKELEWWASSPLFGRGFGIHDAKVHTLTRAEAEGLRHNTWVSTLAETGLIGFSAVALVFAGTFVVGRRLVRDAVDRGSLLLGALAVITATMLAVLGLTTQSFNQVRGAIPLGIVCGLALRCRAMQLTTLRQQQQADGYGDGYYAEPDGYGGLATSYPSAEPLY
jgi:hypothetical protein